MYKYFSFDDVILGHFNLWSKPICKYIFFKYNGKYSLHYLVTISAPNCNRSRFVSLLNKYQPQNSSIDSILEKIKMFKMDLKWKH